MKILLVFLLLFSISLPSYSIEKENYYSEKSNIAPSTPYAVSKASCYWLTKIFRENYNIYACSGILFNHESPLRSNEFVTKKNYKCCKKN